MLELYLPGSEWFDDQTQTFITVPPVIARLEHSLSAVMKWEQIWKKPFLTPRKKDGKYRTIPESVSYAECMLTNPQEVGDFFSYRIGQSDLDKINAYISDTHTATTFSGSNKPRSRDIVTAEVLYYQMASYNIPFECDQWNLDNLLTLIRVCQEFNKASDGKKKSKEQLYREHTALNKARSRKKR